MPENKTKKQHAKEAGGELELGLMKSGDYMIHVFIECTKELSLDAEAGDDNGKPAFDAVMQIGCGDSS